MKMLFKSPRLWWKFEGRYYFIDTLPSGEYLIEENSEFKVGKL